MHCICDDDDQDGINSWKDVLTPIPIVPTKHSGMIDVHAWVSCVRTDET